MTPSRLRPLEAFRALMQTGSVSRGAQKLLLFQPAVTKLLRNLEEETGLPLFDRSRGYLQPTPEAETFEIAVERLFAAADRLDRTIEDMRGVGSGELRVAAMPFFGASPRPASSGADRAGDPARPHFIDGDRFSGATISSKPGMSTSVSHSPSAIASC